MSDEEEAIRVKKQKYLNAEIIQKGYDAMKFKDFLDSKKSNGCQKEKFCLINNRRGQYRYMELF